LLYGHIRQISGAIAPAAVNEGYTDTMHAKYPIQSIGAGLKGTQKSQRTR
jgi:hypothetical protein